MGTVVALAGQVGGAKLADGLYRLRRESLTVIVNTGDDHQHAGLPMSPDIDTLLYTLAGLASAEAGWEPANETRSASAMLRALGGPDRPIVGDRSLAAPILRLDGMRNDRSLTEITRQFARHLGIEARILPMSDDPVTSHVTTSDGVMRFHDYFYELGCEPRLKAFEYVGASDARVSDEARDALLAADLEAVVICPANPYHVIRPILAVSGMQELIRERRAPAIAVSPIIGGQALKGSAPKMMRDLGHEASARAIALEYYKLIDGFVLDRADATLAEGIAASGLRVRVCQTIMRSIGDREALASEVLDLAREIREAREVDEGEEGGA
jgi:LPPG:FO 2-phospho-L-lactate transferase